MVAIGVRVSGGSLAHSIYSRILCAAALAERCGDEPELIAEYGAEVGRLVREHMPLLLFERGSRAVPVDFRRCRSTACGDGAEQGYVRRSEAGLPVTAFVHVVDCRSDAVERSEAEGYECSGERAGNLYIQFWMYYADSATLRGLPVVGAQGYHRDDWESVQIRIRPDRSVDQRASSHNGYSHGQGAGSWGSDADIGVLRDVSEAVGIRSHDGWGRETHVLLVSGGSHAGNATGSTRIDRLTPHGRVHLIPLEPIAATSRARFSISPPWRKHAWRDPEAEGTD
ncbi:MAG TPA: hypothetical protein VF093_09370 [Solirubrobacterales bacterium]